MPAWHVAAFTHRGRVRPANDHLYGLMESQPEVTGMGSTLVGAVLSSSPILAFNVGDSRLYLQTHDHLVQLSQDDVRDHAVDGSGRRTSHGITQALGGSEFPVPIDPHVSIDPPLAPGEMLNYLEQMPTRHRARKDAEQLLIALAHAVEITVGPVQDLALLPYGAGWSRW